MKLFAYVLSGLSLMISTNVFAQTTIGTLMDLEDRVKIKKLEDDLNKSSTPALSAAPGGVVVPPIVPVVNVAPQAAPSLSLPQPKPVIKSPQTINIYGVAPDLKADINILGTNYSVIPGMVVGKFKVVEIASAGTWLEEAIPEVKKKKNKDSKSMPGANTRLIFAPFPNN